MRNLIEFIVLHLVEHPESVAVSEETVDGRLEITITVDDADRGHLIGRHGRTIEAIRLLSTVRAMKDNVMVRVNVAEE